MTASRGIIAHRAMHRFAAANDPCEWPTLAVIDDARLSPDRTWASAIHDAVWREVEALVRRQSEHGVSSLAVAPADALAVESLTARTRDDAPALRRSSSTQVRGALWLVPLRPGVQFGETRPTVTITHAYGVRGYTAKHGVAIAGNVLAHTPNGWDADEVMDQLCTAAHGRLVRASLGRGADDPQTIAHVAHALALGRILGAEVRAVKFACFVPVLDGSELAAVFASQEPVIVVRGDANAIAAAAKDSPLVLVDDGADLSAIIISCLGNRVRRAVNKRSANASIVDSMGGFDDGAPRDGAPATVTPSRSQIERAPEPAHALRPLVQAVEARLARVGIRAADWIIVDRIEPLVRFDRGLRVAGENPMLVAIAAAQLAGSAWASDAIDLLTAHVVTVLNVALAEVTDSTEAHALGALLGVTR
jgi:hypothetical protein